MDTISIAKIVATLVTLVFCTLTGVLEIKKNPDYWLNRFFALFFFFNSLGMVTYASYHLVPDNVEAVEMLALFTQLFWNVGFCLLLLVVPILKHSETVAMKSNWPKFTLAFCIIITIGLILFPPFINDVELYLSTGEVHTDMVPRWWKYVANIYKILILLYVLIEFSLLARHTTGEVRKQMKDFTIGVVLLISGILTLIPAGGQSVEATIFQFVGNALLLAATGITLRGFSRNLSTDKKIDQLIDSGNNE